MKKLNKILALMIVALLALASLSAFAADPAYTGNGGTKTITVNNALIGETYTIYQLFDATTDGENIAYTLMAGQTAIPTEVAGIFEKTTITEGTRTYDAITKKGTPTDAAVQAALKAYAEGSGQANKVGSIECTTGKVEFTNLKDGYYVIVSTFDDGDATKIEKIIGTSTTDEGCTVYEKNTTEIVVGKSAPNDYSIGDTVTYTVTFNGENYRGEGAAAEIVTKYRVTDTLPEFLKDAAVQSIKIGNTTYSGTTLTDTAFPNVSRFGTDKYFDIPWADKGTGEHDWTSKYPNGTAIEITYTATLTKVVKIDGTEGTGNKNVIDINPWTDTPEGPKPREEHYRDDEEIFTYGAALKKTDGQELFLKGAKFHFMGLTLEPDPHYEKGVYTVVSYDPDATTYGTEVEVDDKGYLYIIGLGSEVTLTGEETVAPAGYNKLTSTFTLTPQEMGHTIWTYTEDRYFDAYDNLVSSSAASTETTEVTKNVEDLKPDALEIVNNKGTELPSTGGIGTTIFYVVGSILVLGAAILLVTKRRVNDR